MSTELILTLMALWIVGMTVWILLLTIEAKDLRGTYENHGHPDRARTDHDHDFVYAKIGHNHDGFYLTRGEFFEEMEKMEMKQEIERLNRENGKK